jgi:CDP-paratose 2-epimerase
VDVRDFDRLRTVVAEGDFHAVIHLAGQVAVTTSVRDPRSDFEINALGTFNLLEAVRLYSPESILVNASTNKVYGGLAEVEVGEEATRYTLPSLPHGVSESRPVDFHSPYGCSKGAADQYMVDYARIYGLRTVNLRQSCIYGYRQFGVEDQGWLAWFTIAHLLGRPITLYGTGKQVRDVLFIDDLVRCYRMAIENADRMERGSFNVGGGPENSLSLLEFLGMLGELSDREVEYAQAEPRPGDQPVFVADIRRAAREFGWQPQVSMEEGIGRLYEWVSDHLPLFEARLDAE